MSQGPRELGIIVEGHGEVGAVPELLRRLLHRQGLFDVVMRRPFRLRKSQMLQTDQLERAVTLLGRQVAPNEAILVLLDADDQVPGCLAGQLAQRVHQARPDVSSSVVVAARQFENWFVAAWDGVPERDPDAVVGAKGWIREHQFPGYEPVPDQAALAARMDLDRAERSKSFRKLVRELTRLLKSPAP